MKKLYILAFFSILSLSAFAQLPTFSFGLTGGSTDDDYAYATAVDPAGNVYVGGYFQGTVDFDPSPGGSTTRTALPAGTTDGFIVKFSSTGVFQWVVAIDGTGGATVTGLAADANSVYVTGSFGLTADFNPAGTTTKSSFGQADIFLAKYTNAGALTYVNQYGSTADDIALSLALDGSGNLYIGGAYSLTCDFDPSSAAGAITSWGGYDMFLAKYNNSGAYLWAVGLGGSDEDATQSIALNGNEVIIGGYYSKSFIHADPFDQSVGLSNLGNADGYYGRYSASNGALILGGAVRSSGNDEVTSVRIQSGQLFVGGEFSASATIIGDNGTSKTVDSKGNLDGFVAAFDASALTINWVSTFGGTGDDYVKTISTDLSNLTVAGEFNAPMDIDPSAATVTISNVASSYDAYLVKYTTATGALVTGASFGGAGDDVVYASAYNGNNYFAGAFDGTTDLDPSTVSASTKVSAGNKDFFIMKLTPSEPTLGPSGLTFSNVGATSFNYSFSSSVYPDGYLVLYKAGSAITSTPVDGVTYNVGDIVGDAKVLSVGQFSGIGSATSLAQNTQFFVSVFPYNGASAVINYKTSSPLSGNTTTAGLASEPAASASGFAANRNSSTGKYTISWTAPGGAAPAGYVVLRGTAAPNTDPTDGVALAVGATLGNATIAFIGSSTSFIEDFLNAATSYSYKVYPYNGSAGTTNYRQTSPLTGSFTTYGATEPTAQPSNLVFTAITPTSFTLSFAPAVGASIGGYIGFISTSGPVAFVPKDGTVYTKGTFTAPGSSEIVSFIGTQTSWPYSDLTANTTYYVKVYSYNGTGDQINYREASPLIGSQKTALAPDSDAPVIVDNTPSSAPVNSPVVVSVKVTDPSGVSAVTVTFSGTDQLESNEADMVLKSGTTDTYEYTIPASYMKGVGVEYYVYAVDTQSNGDNTAYRSILVSYNDTNSPTIPYSAGTDQTNYRIVSVPLNLSKNTVADVFADDLGDYDKSKYRVFSYSGGSTSELSGSSSLSLGKGYWFIAAQATTVDIGAGTSAKVGYDTPLTISIEKGWNLIGNPYTIDIAWSLIDGHSDNADKGLGDFKTYNGGFSKGTSLKAMSGGFVMVTEVGNGKLRIPVLDNGGGRKSTPVNFAQTIDSETWGVDLNLKSGDYQNVFAGFGMDPTAKDESDKFDDYTLPRFLDYLELNFNKKLFGSPYTKDIVPTSTQHIWEFEVESNINSSIVELSWNNSYFGSNDLQLVLWDIEQQRAIDMKDHNHYAFEKGQSHGFRVIFGNEAFVKAETLPNRPVFHSVSPVPSAGNVTFAFSLPESKGAIKANLSIYNMMGQKVADLVNGQVPSGYQQAVWNIEEGAKPAAGVYISVLKFGDYTLQKKLIIK